MINIYRLFTKKSIIIIAVLLVAALVLSIYNYLKPYELPTNVFIYVDGELIENLELTDDFQSIDIKTEHGAMEVIIANEKVFVNDSTCTSKHCEKKGKIFKVGQSIYCAENSVLIEIVGESEFEVQTNE